ncbi:hypothetical protein RUM43_001210 [Polyplax serrata]|uniref:Uncharacterized protein n=1 Tax=Polyplax serrata TaxID=468196 RepID=A0AAN8XPV6_POLSC
MEYDVNSSRSKGRRSDPDRMIPCLGSWETLGEIMPTLKNYPKLNDHLSSVDGDLAPGGFGVSPRVSTFYDFTYQVFHSTWEYQFKLRRQYG